MIAKAKAISHGINDIRYITGESHNKKHPEKIYRVLDNMIPSEPDAMGVWNSMQLTLSRFRPVKNSVIRIELSPSPEHTKDFTIEDWQKLWQDFAKEFDKQVFKDNRISLFTTPKQGKMRWHTPYEITDPVPGKTYTRSEGGMYISNIRTDEGRFMEYGAEWIPEFTSPNKIVIFDLDTMNA